VDFPFEVLAFAFFRAVDDFDCFRFAMLANDRVERPATMPVPRLDAAHYASRSASNALLGRTSHNILE
jgi:hypothetical protein